MTRLEFCPYCEEDQPIETLERDEEVTVRGEVFCVPAVVHRCTHCGEEFTCSTDSLDPVDTAFSLYREKYNMLSPSEIRDFRRKYELTQKELSCLLGWGAVTLSRYENGALQDMAHDRLLQTAVTPGGMRKLIHLNQMAINPAKRRSLLEKLDALDRQSFIARVESGHVYKDSEQCIVYIGTNSGIANPYYGNQEIPAIIKETIEHTQTSDNMTKYLGEIRKYAEYTNHKGMYKQFMSALRDDETWYTYSAALNDLKDINVFSIYKYKDNKTAIPEYVTNKSDDNMYSIVQYYISRISMQDDERISSQKYKLESCDYNVNNDDTLSCTARMSA